MDVLYILVKSSNEYSVAFWDDSFVVGILVYYEIMQNLTIVSCRAHILLNNFNKFSPKFIWIVYSVRPVCPYWNAF